MKNFKMIISDLDHTLLTDEKNISKSDIEYIRKAKENGTIFVIATGRIYASAKFYRELLGIDCPTIACNGAIIFDAEDKNIFKQKLDYEQLYLIANIAEKYNQYYHFHGKDYIYTKFDTHKYDKYYNSGSGIKEKANLKVVYSDLKELEEKKIEIYKSLFIALKDEVIKDVESDFSEIENVTITSSSRNNLEVNKSGVNKGKAVEILSEYYKISTDDIICVGDNRNDESMLKTAGLGIAVSNSSESTKKIADEIICSNNQNPLTKVIKEHIL